VRNVTPAREAVIAAARAVLGLTAPGAAYLTLVDPAGDPAHQAQVATLSGCMLVALAVQDAVFSLSARVPYVPGSAPRLLTERAGGSPLAPRGACRLATTSCPPQPGDLLWYGAHGPAVEHVEHALEVELLSNGDLAVTCVAGGQRTAEGREAVAEVARTLTWRGGAWVDVETGRPVLAVLDADRLAQRHGLREEAL